MTIPTRLAAMLLLLAAAPVLADDSQAPSAPAANAKEADDVYTADDLTPSPERQADLRKTLEKRKAKRARLRAYQRARAASAMRLPVPTQMNQRFPAYGSSFNNGYGTSMIYTQTTGGPMFNPAYNQLGGGAGSYTGTSTGGRPPCMGR